MGPGAVDHFWEAPILKAIKVVEKWTQTNLGVHWRAKVYNMFAVSSLQFYLQFYGVTDELLEAEQRALVKVFRGPGGLATFGRHAGPQGPAGGVLRGPQP